MYYIILIIGKLTSFIISTFRLGAGYVWPGHIALKLYPNLFKDPHFKYKKGIILLSGTNGKTTTSKLITHILSLDGYKVVTNISGANLLNGIASAFIFDTDLFGKPKSDIAVFEVDEFTLPNVLSQINPTILLLLNLSRDQLDRYGETDIILDRWKSALEKLPTSIHLILDSTQHKLSVLSQVFNGTTAYFSDDLDNLKHTSLVGEFNAKNINAALEVTQSLNVDKHKSLRNLKDFNPAYGRGELIKKTDKTFHLFLAKNPTSFNNNLDILLHNDTKCDTLLFILNDEVRDGRDVSWIYDIDGEKLSEVCIDKNIYVAGSRCLDFAVRLNYCDIFVREDHLSENIKQLVNKILNDNKASNILVFPNYSAMLSVRKVLLGRHIL